MKELCLHCKPLGHCVFEKAANGIADEFNKGNVKFDDVRIQIMEMRVNARNDLNCPNINNVNPKIKGL